MAAGHSFGVGGVPGCYCPLCLALGRVGRTILDRERSAGFRTHWLDRVRVFASEVQDAAAQDQTSLQPAPVLPAPPGGAATFTPVERESQVNNLVRDTPKEPEGLSTDPKPEREEKPSPRKAEERRKDRERSKERRSKKEKKRARSSSTPRPSGSRRKRSRGEKESSISPAKERKKREKRSPESSPARPKASAKKFSPAKEEPESEVSGSRKEEKKKEEAAGEKKEAAALPPIVRRGPPGVEVKKKPKPPEYPPRGYRAPERERDSHRDRGNAGWYRHNNNWYPRSEKNRGVKKKERLREIRDAGGLEQWHATKSSR